MSLLTKSIGCIFTRPNWFGEVTSLSSAGNTLSSLNVGSIISFLALSLFSVAGPSVVLLVFCLFFFRLVICVCAGEVCLCEGV